MNRKVKPLNTVKKEKDLAKKKDRKWLWKVIFFAIFIPCAAFVISHAFAAFSDESNERFVEQNIAYSQNMAVQELVSLEKNFNDAELALEHQAERITRRIDNGGRTTPVRAMNETSYDGTFDVVAYAGSIGVFTTNSGKTGSFAGTDHFERGINGESGRIYLRDGLEAGHPCIAFYTPVWKGEKISGVLYGFYNEATINSLFSGVNYVHKPYSFLLTKAGNIIAKTKGAPDSENIFADISKSDGVSTDDYVEVKLFYQDPSKRSVSYSDRKNEGATVVTIRKFEDNDFLLMLTIPRNVTTEMLTDVRTNATDAEIQLLTLFSFLIVVFIVQSAVIRKKLKNAVVHANAYLEDVVSRANEANEKNSKFVDKIRSDVKEPLKTIVKIAAAASESVDEPETLMACLEEIAATEEMALDVIEDAINVEQPGAKGRRKTFVQINVPASARVIIDSLKVHFDAKDIEPVFITENIRDSVVIADKERFANFFREFISDAIRRFPSGSTMVITISKKGVYDEGFTLFEMSVRQENANIIKKLFSNIRDNENLTEDDGRKHIADTPAGRELIFDIIMNFGHSMSVISDSADENSIVTEIYFFTANDKNKSLIKKAV